MAEERGLKVDMEGFEVAKARAVEVSRCVFGIMIEFKHNTNSEFCKIYL